MKESLSGQSNPRLTKVEAHQLQKRSSDPDNPYTTLRATIVAEGEGAYEQAFRELSAKEKHEKLCSQIESSAEMTVRIEKYIEGNLDKVDQMTDAELYKVLCRVAFETEDENEIKQKYALSQRRGFKLSIANFLEDRKKLNPYRIEAQTDPKAFAEKYLEEKFTGNVSVEQLPLGFVVYLDEEDFAIFGSRDKSVKTIDSAGVALSGSFLPYELKEKIILINKGGIENGIKTKEKMASTLKHEVRHIIFNLFHEQRNKIYTSIKDAKADLLKCEIEQDYKVVSDMFFQTFIEEARDEIIAYFSQGRFDQTYSALRFNFYQYYMDYVKDVLSTKSDLPNDTKRTILDIFIKDRIKCLEQIRRMRLVSESMYKKGDESQNDFSEALLRNTPGTKIHRLAKYTGFSEEDIKSDKIIKEKDKQVINELDNLPSKPERFDEGWWDAAYEALIKIQEQFPPKAWPSLVNKITEWKKQEWGFSLTKRAIFLIRDFVQIYDVADDEKQKIKQIMNGIASLKVKSKKYRERAKELKKATNEVFVLLKKQSI